MDFLSNANIFINFHKTNLHLEKDKEAESEEPNS